MTLKLKLLDIYFLVPKIYTIVGCFGFPRCIDPSLFLLCFIVYSFIVLPLSYHDKMREKKNFKCFKCGTGITRVVHAICGVIFKMSLCYNNP